MGINTISTINPTCGKNDGSIEVIGFGGIPNYEYQLTNGGIIFTLTGNTNTSITFNNLTGGTWTLLLTDSSGVTITEIYYLSPLNVTTIVSGSTLNVNLSGDSSPYNIYIDGNIVEVQNNNSFNVSYTASCDASHNLLIVDKNDCEYLVPFVIPCEPIGVQIHTIFNSFCYD